MVPGKTQFTLIPLCLSSEDILSVSRMTALLEALYAAALRTPLKPGLAETLTIFP